MRSEKSLLRERKTSTAKNFEGSKSSSILFSASFRAVVTLIDSFRSRMSMELERKNALENLGDIFQHKGKPVLARFDAGKACYVAISSH